MKKMKKTESVNLDDQFADFNPDDFADLNELDQDSSADPLTNQASSDFETEYHGADPDLPDGPQEGRNQSAKKSIGSFIKENWLYVGIGTVVIIVAAYLIMGVFSSNTPPQQAAPAPQTTASFNNVPNTTSSTSSTAPATVSATPAAAVSTSTTSTTTNAPALASAPASTNGSPSTSGNVVITKTQLQKLMAGFNKTVQQNSAALQKTVNAQGSNAQLTTVKTSVDSLTDSVTKLTTTLAAVQQQLSTTQSQLNTLLAQQTASSQDLTLRAVVPGRAWLIDGKGNTTSVTVGTTLGNLGTVTNIDATNNTVTTSSGYVFN